MLQKRGSIIWLSLVSSFIIVVLVHLTLGSVLELSKPMEKKPIPHEVFDFMYNPKVQYLDPAYQADLPALLNKVSFVPQVVALAY